MDHAENLLPLDKSLEGNLVDRKAELYARLDAPLDGGGDVLDVDNEKERDFIRLIKFSEGISCLISTDEAEQRVIRDAVYRSLCFAAQLADDLLPPSYDCDVVSYMVGWLSTGGFALVPLVEDCRAYLQARPEVQKLIKHYMPEIDVSGSYNEISEAFAGMVCMLAERSVAEQYVSASIGTMSVQDFIDGQEWD